MKKKAIGLSGSTLKVIALLSMFCDHGAKFFLRYFDFTWTPFFTMGGHKVHLFFVLSNVIGRIAFPLFAFLLVEGYLHTRNVKRYALNLLLFAILSTLPYNVLRNGGALHFDSLNVLFTLQLGLLAITAIDRLKGWKTFGCVMGCLALAYALKVDYNVLGVVMIVLLFALRNRREHQALATVASLFRGVQTTGVFLAAVPMVLYNGKRGFIHGRWGKYLFYAIYPLHLLVLCVMQWWWGIGWAG